MTQDAEKKTPINPSLQKKSAARMAAVQCLYTASIHPTTQTAAQQVATLKKQLSGNQSEQALQVGIKLEPNYKLLETILEGVEQWRGEIDKRLDRTLNQQWTRERTSPILIAILQCGIFELFFDKDLAHNVVIDEYTRLTRSFFADSEVDFVHAALSHLASEHG